MKNYPIQISCPIRWGEMDALGHVNNTIYFRYFEEVRLAYFKAIGFEAVTATHELGPILAQINCQFIQPLVFPDHITIGVWVPKIGNTSLHMHYEVYSEQIQSVVAEGTSVVVLINYKTGNKVPVSDQLRDQIQELQADFSMD